MSSRSELGVSGIPYFSLPPSHTGVHCAVAFGEESKKEEGLNLQKMTRQVKNESYFYDD